MKITIDITTEEWIAIQKEKDKVSIEHREAWIQDMASMAPPFTPEERARFNAQVQLDGQEIMGSSLRTTRFPDEPPFCPDLD